jgi:WD40 repeat protein
MLTTWRAYEIKVVDIHSFRLLPKIKVNSGSIGTFDLSPDGKLLAIGMTRAVELRNAQKWKTRGWKLLSQYSHGGQCTNVQFGPRGQTLLCTWGGWTAMRPHCLNVTTMKQIAWPRWVYRVQGSEAWAFTTDGKHMVRASAGRIEVWTTPTTTGAGKMLQSFPSKLKRVTCLAFSPNGKTLVAGGLSSDHAPVEFFDLHQ